VAGEVYDYMIGLIIVGLIFGSAVLVVANLSYVNLLYVDQQQLRNVALTALKSMLLDTGDPVNWGSDPNGIQRFGLASSAGGSFYVLDPNKVQRLDIVGYDKVRDLLGLEGYGFSLRILPPFNVTITDRNFDFTEQQTSIGFTVKVLRHDGRPLANAAVYPTIIYSVEEETTGNVSVKSSTASTRFTDLLGRCEINELLTPPEGGRIRDVIAFLRVTVAGIETVVDIYHGATNPSEVIEIDYGTGDNVTLRIPEEEYPFDQPNEADWVCNVAAYYGQGDVLDMYSGTQDTDKITWGEGYKTWNGNIPGIQSSDPALVIFVLSCVPKGLEGEGSGKGKGIGRTPILIVSPGPNHIDPEGLHFGGNISGPTVRIGRNVIISGMKYLLEMTLWKEG